MQRQQGHDATPCLYLSYVSTYRIGDCSVGVQIISTRSRRRRTPRRAIETWHLACSPVCSALAADQVFSFRLYRLACRRRVFSVAGEETRRRTALCTTMLYWIATGEKWRRRGKQHLARPCSSLDSGELHDAVVHWYAMFCAVHPCSLQRVRLRYSKRLLKRCLSSSTTIIQVTGATTAARDFLCRHK